MFFAKKILENSETEAAHVQKDNCKVLAGNPFVLIKTEMKAFVTDAEAIVKKIAIGQLIARRRAR
jgi:hypothetical protein